MHRTTTISHVLCAVLTSLLVWGSAAPAWAGRALKEAVAAVDLEALAGPWEHVFVDVIRSDSSASLRMHALAAGPVDAPRVVLLHGFPDFSFGWRAVIPLLSEDHRVLAPDLRGYAATDKPEDGFDVGTLVADVLGFAEAAAIADGVDPALAAAPIHWVTHDWGSAIGWVLAAEHPERVASMTVTSVPHPAVLEAFIRDDAQQRRQVGYMGLLAKPVAVPFFAGLGPKRRARLYLKELGRPEVFGEQELAAYIAAFDTKEETFGPLSYYRIKARDAAALTEWSETSAPLAVPTLVVWGRDDGVLKWEMAEASCARVVGAPCVAHVIDGARHFVPWDAAEAMVSGWRAFVGAAQTSNDSP